MKSINLAKYIEGRSVRSFGHATLNEGGMEEFSIEFEKTLFQTIFNRPATKFVFVRPKVPVNFRELGLFDWCEKGTGRLVYPQWAITQCIQTIRGKV